MPARKAGKRKQTGQVEEGTNKQPRLLNFKELIDFLLLGEPVGEPGSNFLACCPVGGGAGGCAAGCGTAPPPAG